MIRRVTLAGVCVLGVVVPAVAQQPDMAAMQKWAAVKRVSWHIVGKYDGDTSVTSDGQGRGRVTDTIEIDVVVDVQNNNAIVGTPAIKNAPATVSNLHDPEPKCLAPTLNGAFDLTLDSVTPGQIGGLHLNMTTSYPEAKVSQSCSSTKLAPAKKETDEKEFQLPQPTLLAMGISNESLKISPDKKSIIVKGSGSDFRDWTWTLTPTPR